MPITKNWFFFLLQRGGGALTTVVLLSLFIILLGDRYAFAQQGVVNSTTEQAAVSDILDRWTVLHWGQDSVVWIVHYPEELVEPYVRLEAVRRGFTAEQAANYKKAFREELRMEKALAFMVSVHVFGSTPILLSPVSETIQLVDASGRGHAPLSYEKKLDIPVKRFSQGFVFFKRIAAKNLTIRVKNLIPGKETLFSFNRTETSVPLVPKNIDTKNKPQPTLKEKPQARRQPKPPAEPEVLIKIPIVTTPQAPSKPSVGEGTTP